MDEQLAKLPMLLSAHVRLTLAALAVGLATSVPLGVLATRVRWLRAPALLLVGVVQTIPGLALLAFMVPLLAAFSLPSIGFLPAFIALSLYSALPILQNTVAGLEGVDPALTEAADGVGMTARERLLRVELPLAAPVMLAGLRTATVWTVGMATLSTPIGAPSLGNYIFSGLATRNYEAILVGCAGAATLALVLDAIVSALERGADARRRKHGAIGVLALATLTAAAIAPALGSQAVQIRIGAKPFTEQYILSELLADVAEGAGAEAEVLPSLGSTVAFDALKAGDIDAYVDYTGTIWATMMGRQTDGVSREDIARGVETWLAEEHGIDVAARLGFENTYALAMRRRDAERLGVARVSDLAGHAPELTVGGDYELFERAEWAALETRYGLSFAAERAMDPALMYEAMGTGTVDVIGAYSTDGRIAAFDLVVLEDELGVIPPYDAIVLVRGGLDRDAPELRRALSALDAALPAERMRELNRRVDVEGQSPAHVATNALIDEPGATTPASTVAGPYRAVLRSPGGPLPFTLIVDDGGAHVGNGEERVAIDSVTVEGGVVTFAMPGYDAELVAAVLEQGDRLVGEWHKTSSGQPSRLPFVATRGEAPRFSADLGDLAPRDGAGAAALPSVAGHFRVVFTDASGDEVTRGEFHQEGRRAHGTILTATGDYRYLEGDYHKGLLRLSTFDGAHAFLFHAEAQGDGSLVGDFWSRDSYHASFIATALDEREQVLPDPFSEVHMVSADRRLRFVGEDLDGRAVRHEDERFEGKVLLVDVFGTWCPNCADLAPLLSRWRARYGDRGLEVVGLAFEYTGDPDRDRRQLRRYAEEHGVTYPLLLAGTSDKQRAGEILSDLSSIRSYPTTIFIGRDGTVRRIHSGFAGPATGAHHEQLLEVFEAQIEALLAEPAP